MSKRRIFVADGVEVHKDEADSIDVFTTIEDPRPEDKDNTLKDEGVKWLFSWDHYDGMKDLHVFRGAKHRV